MRLEVLDNRIIVHQTGSQNNGIEYDSNEDISNYTRRNLTFIEYFLRDNNQLEEADKIKKHMGKTIKSKHIERVIPTGNYMVNIPLDMLKDRIERDIEQYGLDLNPDFQRGHVWNMNQRIAFVEFILQDGKTNPIYFNHEGWMMDFKGDYVIVDGCQRLTSLLMFLNNEFPVFKDLDTEDNVGFFASEFDLIHQDIVFVVNTLNGKDLVLKWYLNMNKGNIQHSDEEIKRVENMLAELKNKNKGE